MGGDDRPRLWKTVAAGGGAGVLEVSGRVRRAQGRDRGGMVAGRGGRRLWEPTVLGVGSKSATNVWGEIVGVSVDMRHVQYRRS